MTSGLRKTHKIIWLLLIIVIPILLVLSVNSIKESLLIDGDVTVSETSGQRTVLDDESFLIGIKELETSNTLQLILKKPLKSASSLVYGVTPSNTDGKYLGTLDKKGVYTFKIDKSIKSIRVYDEIKKNNIVNIEL
ncbi:hypothetical protein [Aquimarina sp. 2201CG14-23]|uniref:hypothetical protein n=1 Tax=Aquimarina mycalae TaxID=3040073 RepID=UPI002477FF71|nr:hypothetical protein [Aquimarina sp. 2201CG14-23]MDH7447762.1 hypothetical protein [Aquimarina sp. 2201CG14-23]